MSGIDDDGLCFRYVIDLLRFTGGDAIAVAQVDECHTTHFAAALHPSGQGYFLANIFDAKFAACVGSIHSCMLLNV